MKNISLVSAILLSFGLISAMPITASAVETTTAKNAIIVTSRPSSDYVADLLKQIEAIGDYKTLFANTDTLSSEVSGYQEYNWLHRIAGELQNHTSKTDAQLSEWVDAAENAIVGCRLRLGIVQKEKALENAANSTTSSNQASSANSSSSASSNNVAKPSTSNATANNVASTATSEPKKDVETPAGTTVSVTVTGSSNQAEDDIDVPATGEVETPVSFNALTILAGVIVSIAVLSVLLTIVLHRQPRRHHARRR